MFAKGLETCKPVEIFIKLLKHVYGQFIIYHVIIKAMYASVFPPNLRLTSTCLKPLHDPYAMVGQNY